MSEQERAEGQAVSPNEVGSGAPDAVAREIGTTLSAARQQQGASLDDIAARLKVSKRKLAAIEAGETSALPDLTFAKGLMRAYARILHADIDPLLARFHAQAAPVVEMTARPRGSLNESFDDRNRFAAKSSGGRWVWLALVVVVIGAGALFGLDHARQWIDAQRETLTETSGDAVAVPTTGEPGIVTAALPPVMSGLDSSAPSEGTMEGAAQSQAPLIAGLPATASTPAAPVAPAAAGTAATIAPVASTPTAPVAAGPGELRLRFSEETWFEVRDGAGKVVMGGTAKAGDEIAGGGAPPYKIVIGNVKGLASMTRNGSPVDIQASNRNNIARVTLP